MVILKTTSTFRGGLLALLLPLLLRLYMGNARATAVPKATAWSAEVSARRIRRGPSPFATLLTISVAACGLAGQLCRDASPEERQPRVTLTRVPSTSTQVSEQKCLSKVGVKSFAMALSRGAEGSEPVASREETLTAR